LDTGDATTPARPTSLVDGLATSPYPIPFRRRLELPDWHSMRITVAGGATHDVDLKLLSLEQRQILWRAIARRANLVEIREQP
jgi:hypothetical protein